MSADRTSGTAFLPGRIGPLTLRNRTIRAAAFEGLSAGGHPSTELIELHRRLAAGGVGMTTVAYAAVSADGRSFAHQLLMSEEIVDPLRRLTDAVHAEGAAAAIQLGHGGNMADQKLIGRRPLAPSAVFNMFGLALPRAMSAAELETLEGSFARAARQAREAGFDAVEIQAGHGYLLSQFLSPATNRRTDAWGGSLRNRARLLRQVVRRVRAQLGSERALLVKINLRDGFRGGMELDESVEVARLLQREGVDGLVLSGGFVSKCPWYVMRGELPLREMIAAQSDWLRKLGLLLFGRLVVKTFPYGEAYFLGDALRVREAVRLPLVLVGGINSLATIERVLADGFEFVAMARALIREPDLVQRFRLEWEQGEAPRALCEPCNKCIATMYFGAAVCPDREKRA
jgi:2,4-dienoyl-CoA reductase-like NADH-dependent reductase (Old Yellow Enzyme family)